LFLASPLLGGVSFEPLVESLAAHGWTGRIADLPADPVTPEGGVESYIGQVESTQPDLLVAHSNAGYFAPVIAQRTGGRTILFMDAALPSGEGATALAPARFNDFLASLPVVDGRLPRWSEWWPEGTIEGLIPDEDWRDRVVAAQPRLPVDYFTATVHVPEGWVDQPIAYLGFGDTYAEEMQFASDRGWPAVGLEGRHLHHLEDPDGVAEAVVDLVSRLEEW
jgi:hypothetical protein